MKRIYLKLISLMLFILVLTVLTQSSIHVHDLSFSTICIIGILSCVIITIAISIAKQSDICIYYVSTIVKEKEYIYGPYKKRNVANNILAFMKDFNDYYKDPKLIIDYKYK